MSDERTKLERKAMLMKHTKGDLADKLLFACDTIMRLEKRNIDGTDALSDSLRDMVEYAEEHAEREDEQWGRYCQEKRDRIRADIAKARGLLK